MKKGKIWFAIGLLLIVAALALTLYNVWDNLRAGNTSEEYREQLDITPAELQENEVPDYILNPEMEMPVKTIGGRDYVGELSLPTINRKLPVLNEWDYTNLRIAPCRYQGSAYLDNRIICAHNYDSHFGQIKNLSYGDQVTFTDMDGNVFEYRVADIQILKPTAVKEMESGGWDLTLFTCTIGGRTRVTVRCEKAE